MHGGPSPAGIASPTLKTGERSRYLGSLGPRMQERFRAAQQNDDLLSLNPDLWMLDARLEDLIERAEAGENQGRLKDALEAFEEFAAAQVAKDRETAFAALQRLSDILRKGTADYEAWNEVKDLWKQRTRMVESERRRKLENQQMVAVDYMLVMATALLASVKRHVENQETLKQIQSEFARITGQGRGDSSQLLSGWTHPSDG